MNKNCTLIYAASDSAFPSIRSEDKSPDSLATPWLFFLNQKAIVQDIYIRKR